MAVRPRHLRDEYVRVRGRDRQLFDLEAEPHERTDLADDPGHADTGASLGVTLLDWFDPDRTTAEAAASGERRHVVRRVMTETGTTRSHAPNYDATLTILDRYNPN